MLLHKQNDGCRFLLLIPVITESYLLQIWADL